MSTSLLGCKGCIKRAAHIPTTHLAAPSEHPLLHPLHPLTTSLVASLVPSPASLIASPASLLASPVSLVASPGCLVASLVGSLIASHVSLVASPGCLVASLVGSLVASHVSLVASPASLVASLAAYPSSLAASLVSSLVAFPASLGASLGDYPCHTFVWYGCHTWCHIGPLFSIHMSNMRMGLNLIYVSSNLSLRPYRKKWISVNAFSDHAYRSFSECSPNECKANALQMISLVLFVEHVRRTLSKWAPHLF